MEIIVSEYPRWPTVDSLTPALAFSGGDAPVYILITEQNPGGSRALVCNCDGDDPSGLAQESH